jgi:hypothetical protein
MYKQKSEIINLPKLLLAVKMYTLSLCSWVRFNRCDKGAGGVAQAVRLPALQW